jgi:transcriptional regulator with XRE-family HTH domain
MKLLFVVKRIYPDLAAFLAATGMTQSEFASRVGISQPVISRIVNRKQRRLDWSMAERISKEARVPLESLTSEAA